MIENLKPYPAYKDTGSTWLGDVPSHWDVRRAKFMVREVDERSTTGEEELLTVSHKTGVTPRREKSVTMFLAESNVGHKKCQSGDIVINTMWAWMAAIGVSKHRGLISPSYGVYRPIQAEAFLHTFLDEILRTPAYRNEYITRSTGITNSRLRLYPDAFLRIPLLVPPILEQEAIVRFVGHVDQRIRRYMAAKQKLIKLLNEQKQTIIRRAVTRGLDPNIRLKTSGVLWLGDVPEHWEISRVKNEFLCLNHRRVPLSATERGNMSLRHYDYYGASGIIDKVDEYLFEDELLLIAEDGANLVLRNLPLAIIARGRFWVNNHAHILKPKRGNLEYLAALMESINYLPWISGAAQPKLTQDRLMGIAVAIAPQNEQNKIVEAIRTDTASLRAAIDRACRELDLFRAYRTRLIADVVTGKLDVREAAAKLPDDADEFMLIDELEGIEEAGLATEAELDQEMLTEAA